MMPKPTKGESKDKFISRFMADETMMKEYPDEKQRYVICLEQWGKMNKEFSAEMETVDLMGVPIFSTGVWEGKGSADGGDNITESTLDSWVKTFKEIGSKVKPRMRITHDATASKNILNSASLGWVTDLKRDGGKLLADFKSVPKKIADLITKKAFGRFSPGIYSSMSVNGITYNDVLDHVALLGAELPANMDLDGFIDLYYENEITETGNLICYENEIKVQERNQMDHITYEKEYKESLGKLTEFEKKIEVMSKRIGELEKEKSSLSATIEQVEYEKTESEVKTFLESAIREGKISPAMLNEYMALCVDKGVKEYSYDEGKKKVSGTAFELVKSIIGNMPKVFEFKQESHNVDKPDEKDEDEITEKEIQEYVTKHKVSEREAYKAIGKSKTGVKK